MGPLLLTLIRLLECVKRFLFQRVNVCYRTATKNKKKAVCIDTFINQEQNSSEFTHTK
jgi:hypothetical protein